MVLSFMQGIKGSRRWAHRNNSNNSQNRSRSHSAAAAIQPSPDIVISIGNPSHSSLQTLPEHDAFIPRHVTTELSPKIELNLGHDAHTFLNEFSRDLLGESAVASGSRSPLKVDITPPPPPPLKQRSQLGSQLSLDSQSHSAAASSEALGASLKTPMQTHPPNSHLNPKTPSPQPSNERVRPIPAPLAIPDVVNKSTPPPERKRTAPPTRSGHQSPSSEAEYPDNASAISGLTVARDVFEGSFLFPGTADTERGSSSRQSYGHRSGIVRQDSATLPKDGFFTAPWWNAPPGTASSSIKSPSYIPPVPPLPTSALSSPGTTLNTAQADATKNAAKRISDGGRRQLSGTPPTNGLQKFNGVDQQGSMYKISRIPEANSPAPSTPDTPEGAREKDRRVKQPYGGRSRSQKFLDSPSGSLRGIGHSSSSHTLLSPGSATTPRATSPSSFNTTPSTPTPRTATSADKDKLQGSFLDLNPYGGSHSAPNLQGGNGWESANGMDRKAASEGTEGLSGLRVSVNADGPASFLSAPPSSQSVPSPSSWRGGKQGTARSRSKSKTRRRSSVASLKDTASIKKKPATLQLMADRRYLTENSSKRSTKRDSASIAMLPIGNRGSTYSQQLAQQQTAFTPPPRSDSASSSTNGSVTSAGRSGEEHRPSLQVVTPPMTAAFPALQPFPTSAAQSGSTASTSASTSAGVGSPDLLDVLVERKQVIGPKGSIPRRTRKRSATTPGGTLDADKDRNASVPFHDFRTPESQRFPETPQLRSPESQSSNSASPHRGPRAPIWSTGANGTLARNASAAAMPTLTTMMSSEQLRGGVVGVQRTGSLGRLSPKTRTPINPSQSSLSISTTPNNIPRETAPAPAPLDSPDDSPPISPLPPPPSMPSPPLSPPSETIPVIQPRTPYDLIPPPPPLPQAQPMAPIQDSPPPYAAEAVVSSPPPPPPPVIPFSPPMVSSPPSISSPPPPAVSLGSLKRVAGRPAGPRAPSSSRQSGIYNSSSQHSASALNLAGPNTTTPAPGHLRSQASTSTLGNSIRSISRRPTLVGHQPPEFKTERVKWRGYTFDAAKWTFTSKQLQSIVSKAIHQSAEPSSIRLLPPEVVDEELPAEMSRLEASIADLKMSYKHHAQKRRMRLGALTSNASGMSEGGAVDTCALMRQAEELSESCMVCDQLSEDIYRQADQLAQIGRLRDIHSASALSMALRKINTSLIQRMTEVASLREELETVKAERDDAWAKAEELAHEYDQLNDQVDATGSAYPPSSFPQGSISVNGAIVPKSPQSRRSSQVSLARMNSARVSKAGLRSSIASSQNKRGSKASVTRSSIMSARSSAADDVPPVPRLPDRIPLAVSTDVRHRQSMGFSPEAPPSSGIHAMDQAHRELLEELGFSGSPARPHSAGPYATSPRSPPDSAEPSLYQTVPGHISRMSLPESKPKREAPLHNKETILAILSLPPLI